MEKMTFLAEEIFHEIDGDPDNIMMTIPPEILERNGWKEGDTLTVKLEDGAIVISKE
jgi:formylmethanofuran dehydrogenase subunit D